MQVVSGCLWVCGKMRICSPRMAARPSEMSCLLQVDLQFFLEAGKTIPLKNRFFLEKIRLQGR